MRTYMFDVSSFTTNFIHKVVLYKYKRLEKEHVYYFSYYDREERTSSFSIDNDPENMR